MLNIGLFLICFCYRGVGGGGGVKTIFCLPHYSKGSTNAPLPRLLRLWFSEWCFVDDSFCRLCSIGHCLSDIQVLPTNPTYFPCDNHLILTEISEHIKSTTYDVGITTPGSGQTLQLLARDIHYNSWLGTDITTPGSEQTQTCYSYLKYTLRTLP